MNNTNDTQTSKRIYDAVNVKKETKQMIDTLYYSLKVKKNYKSFDDFIKEVFDVFRKINKNG